MAAPTAVRTVVRNLLDTAWDQLLAGTIKDSAPEHLSSVLAVSNLNYTFGVTLGGTEKEPVIHIIVKRAA